MGPGTNITDLLERWRSGDRGAFDQAVGLLYDELHKAAGGCLRWSPRDSLQPTLLIHEAYLRLAGSMPGPLEDRRHFLAIAAKVMRRILVDRVREASALKRAGDAVRVPLDENTPAPVPDFEDCLVLDQQLDRLEEAHPDWARVIELRYFGGYGLEETAAALGISVPTVVRRQRVAEAWLARKLGPRGTGDLNSGESA